MATKRGKGRPPIDDRDNVREITFGVRVSASEYDELLHKAKVMNMTPTAFMREMAFSSRLPKPSVNSVDIGQYENIDKIANNINQIAQQINENLSASIIDMRLLQNLMDEIRNLRMEVLGNERDS